MTQAAHSGTSANTCMHMAQAQVPQASHSPPSSMSSPQDGERSTTTTGTNTEPDLDSHGRMLSVLDRARVDDYLVQFLAAFIAGGGLAFDDVLQWWPRIAWMVHAELHPHVDATMSSGSSAASNTIAAALVDGPEQRTLTEMWQQGPVGSNTSQAARNQNPGRHQLTVCQKTRVHHSGELWRNSRTTLRGTPLDDLSKSAQHNCHCASDVEASTSTAHPNSCTSASSEPMP